MKKMLALLLAACLAAGCTACGGTSGDSGGGRTGSGSDGDAEKDQEVGASSGGSKDSGNGMTEISLWTYPVGNWGNSVVVAGLISDFMQKYPKIHISVKYLDYATGDEEVREAIEEGRAPDLILEGPERMVADWGNKGLMADLSETGRASCRERV